GAGQHARDRERMDAIAVPAVELDELRILRALPADRAAHDHGGALLERRRPLEPRIAHRLARRDQRELGETVEQLDLPGFEVRLGIEAAHLGAVSEAQAAGRDALEGLEARSPFAQRRPELAGGRTQRADAAQTGHDDPAHQPRPAYAGRAPNRRGRLTGRRPPPA